MAAILTDETFKEKVLKAEKPVLVDFFAEWCGPCKMLVPVIEALAEEYKDKVDIYKVNVDESIDTASHYGVQSIPTLILFRGGEAVNTLVGLQQKNTLVELLNSAL